MITLFKRLFLKKRIEDPVEMNMLQRAIFTYTKGYFNRKPRKYYMKSYGCSGVEFENPKIQIALNRMCSQ